MAMSWSAGRRSGGKVEASALALIPLLLFMASLATPASAVAHVVGGGHHWSPGVNYTVWAAGQRFYVQDWLVFYFEKGMYDVVEVRNGTAYERCVADDPVLNWSRGHSYAMQLNRTGPYYFICSRGYCYAGMKVSILVEPLPPPSPSPSHSSSSAATLLSSWLVTTVAAAAALL